MGRRTGRGLPWLLRGERASWGHYGCPSYCSRKPCPKAPGQTGAAPHTPLSGLQPPPHPLRSLSCGHPGPRPRPRPSPQERPRGGPQNRASPAPCWRPAEVSPDEGLGAGPGTEGACLLVDWPGRAGEENQCLLNRGIGCLAGNGAQCQRDHPEERHRQWAERRTALQAAEVPGPATLLAQRRLLTVHLAQGGPRRRPAAAVMDGQARTRPGRIQI